MYWHSIMTLLIWPVLILVTYWLVIFVLKKTDNFEQRQEGKDQ
jgi:heme/copper-type cytochrome/quinol oxidase subunit 2